VAAVAEGRGVVEGCGGNGTSGHTHLGHSVVGETRPANADSGRPAV
jgi:hypothetical protein